MFDLFDFTPVDYDPFAKAGQTKPVQTPTPKLNDPNLPTHMLQGPSLPTHMMPGNDLYGDVQPVPSPGWPSGIPRDVQTYMYMNPSYAEGQRQTMLPSRITGVPSIPGGIEPYSETPQIGDIRRLFQHRQMLNSPNSGGMSAQDLRNLMQLPGFAGFAGGDEI